MNTVMPDPRVTVELEASKSSVSGLGEVVTTWPVDQQLLAPI